MIGKSQILKVEKKFLAYLFSNKRYIAASLGKINKDHLTNTHFIYSLLVRYYNNYKDVITDEMIEISFHKRNIDTNTMVVFRSIISEVRALPIVNDAEFEALIMELCDYKKRQDYVDLADLIVKVDPVECSTDQLEKMEAEIKGKIVELTAETSNTRREGTMQDSIDERRDRYNEIKTNPNSIITIPTGFKCIDNAEGGFRPGELIYIIGRKGDGKSVLMLNLAHNVWAQGKNVILFSLEISKEDYERRFDSRAAGVSTTGLKLGKLTEVEESLYWKYLDDFKKGFTPNGKKAGKIYIVDVPNGCTPAYIESKVDTVEQLLNIKFDVIVSDYAGIMKPNIPTEIKRFEQSQIALDLKRIARCRDCVVISAAQMNRRGKDESKNERVESTAIAESDSIGDHIDWGIAIKSISDSSGKIESFKTRDAAPFEFHFNKKYSQMLIMELDDNLKQWDQMG